MLFSGDAGDASIVNALEEILKCGNKADTGQAFFALLKSCQNKDLPESTRQDAKLLLLKFSEKLKRIEGKAREQIGDVDADIDHLIAESLRDLLMLRIEPIQERIEIARVKLDFQNYCANALIGEAEFESCSVTSDELSHTQPIYSYLKSNVDHFEDQLLDKIFPLIEVGKADVAKITCQIMFKLGRNGDVLPLTWKISSRDRNLTSDLLSYFTKIVCTNKLPKTAYSLGKMYLDGAKHLKA